MSYEKIYKHDYKKFKRNHANNRNNTTNISELNLSSSDLRNKINSKRSSMVDSSNSDRQKRQNERNNDMAIERRLRNSTEDIKYIEQSNDIELYKEYVQWDFINNKLYDKGKYLMNISTARSVQEFTNTLQRWFIFINEEFNRVPKYEYYSILPNIALKDPGAQFLRAAIIEKKFVTIDEADEKTEAILKFIAKNHSNVIPHNLTEPLHVEYNSSRKIIVVNKFQSPEVPRVDLLVNKGGIIASARMLLRYESFGNGSYQWGDPKEVHKVLYDRFNVRHEGFASPVNSRFIEYEQTHFCSLFPDTDRVFGSLGNFFDVDMRQHSGGWSVNPPFLNDLMKNVADRINQVLDDRCPCYFFCTFPWWEDDEGWLSLNNSRHLIKRFDLRAHHFIVQDAYGNKFEPKMAMNLFVMGDLPLDVARLTELGNTLIFNSAEAFPDNCPW